MCLNDFLVLKRPLWLSFYSVMQKYNPAKPIPQIMLEAMTLDSWPRKKREDFWVYRKEVSQPRANIGNAHLDECFELEWHQYNKSDEETGDSSPHGDSSPEVAQRQDIEVISTEEQDKKPRILLPLPGSARRPLSQAGKRQDEKQALDSPSGKKQYLGSAKKGSSSPAPKVPPIPQWLVTSTVHVRPSLPFPSTQVVSSSTTHLYLCIPRFPPPSR